MTSFKYKVNFGHENEYADDESVRHGSGSVEITTDHKIMNQDDQREVARSIGLTYGFTTVAITEFTLLEEVEDIA